MQCRRAPWQEFGDRTGLPCRWRHGPIAQSCALDETSDVEYALDLKPRLARTGKAGIAAY